METMLASLIVDQQEMVKHFDGRLDCHSRRQERHRAELESLKTQRDKHSNNQEEIVLECEFLKAQILSMESQLCCGEGRVQSGREKGWLLIRWSTSRRCQVPTTVHKGHHLLRVPFVRTLLPSLCLFRNRQVVHRRSPHRVLVTRKTLFLKLSSPLRFSWS